jgi:Icc-related predicted phosphoesterase
MRITLFSDTHTIHEAVRPHLPGGDILIHAGDSMNSGYRKENVTKFLTFLDDMTEIYDNVIYIAGNHDRLYENDPDLIKDILCVFPDINYLQDDFILVNDVKIYGSPWQPEFCNWAFNLTRDGKTIREKWQMIPDDTDILITHGPAFGHLDIVKNGYKPKENLGCRILAETIDKIKPKIHVCGHIHTGNGHEFSNDTHYFNASVLNEQYQYEFHPVTFDWDKPSNSIKWVLK